MLLLLSEGVDLGAKLQDVAVKAEAQVLPATANRPNDQAIMIASQGPEGIK